MIFADDWIFVTGFKTLLTSDDEFSKVGDGRTPGGQGDAAVEVLLPTLRLHLECCHQPFMAQPRQQGSIQHHAVSPLTARQRPQREKSAVRTAVQSNMFAWSLLKGLEKAVKQRGTKRTAWISNMAWQDNKSVINVTGKQTNKEMFSLARQVTQD